MWKAGWRDEVWSRLDVEWDLVVIGGGITGAGILAEAARMGLKALLVEARDFASGTSSRSTKLVHGGLRYLRQAQFRVTRESVLERERLLREAGGLVSPLGFYLTSFRNDTMPTWMFGAGLAIYDLIARKWAHTRHTSKTLLESVPSLQGADLKGGYHYFDAQTDDARLVVRVLREAVMRGGTALNYAPVTGLLRDQSGAVRGAVITDTAGFGRTVEVKAKVVVNATGAWVDDIRDHVGAQRKMRMIRGSHLVFPHAKLPIGEAITLLHPRDGRAVFAIPWEGVTIFGTTDVDHKDDLSLEPRIATSEAEYIMESAHHAFPNMDLSLNDVRSSWAGVRAVVNTGASNPAKESRDHALWKEDGLLTVAGGKLTTFRLMALEALAAVAERIPDMQKPERGRILDDAPENGLADVVSDAGLRARLMGRYGTETSDVVASGELDIIGDSPNVWSEIRWAAGNEGVVHLDDLLLRRVRIGLLLPEGGIPLLAKVRAHAQAALGWDDAKWDEEEKRYVQIWKRSYGTEYAPG